VRGVCSASGAEAGGGGMVRQPLRGWRRVCLGRGALALAGVRGSTPAHAGLQDVADPGVPSRTGWAKKNRALSVRTGECDLAVTECAA
jgi:hypothetical protein